MAATRANMKLCEFDRNNIQNIVGTKCTSFLGTHGIVTHLHLSDLEEDHSVEIYWDNGKKSRVWLFWCNYITILE